jgi:hypothetical protein
MRILMSTALALGAIGCALLVAPSVHAREYPWCAQYAGSVLPSGRFAMLAPNDRSDARELGGLMKEAHVGGGRNCGFDTYEQCKAAIAGVGGSCERNLFYQGEPPAGAPRARRDGRRY